MPIQASEELRKDLFDIVDSAIAIAGADFGNIQIFDPDTNSLNIVAHRGFPDWWIAFWNTVSAGRGACGTALERRSRVIVEDVETSPIFSSEALEMQRRAGVRAVQSTPIISRSGRKLGMFSTHYAKVGRPDERALGLLDLLARQAADLIERHYIDQELYSSRALLALFIAHAPAAIAMVDREMRYLYVSDRWFQILGVPKQDLTHRSHYDFFPDPTGKRKATLHDRIMSGETITSEGEFVLCPDGVSRFLRFECRPWYNANGSVGGMAAFVEDVSRGEARFQSVVNSMSDGLLLVDRRSKIDFANARLHEMFGYGPGELIGQEVARLIPSEFQKGHGALHEKFLTEPKQRQMAGANLNIKGQRKDGSRIPIEVALCPIPSPTGLTITVVVRDISDRKSAEEARAKLLEGERHAREAAEDASRAKDAFMAILSHELRTPLTAILSWAQILRQKADQPQILRHGLETICTSAKAQAQLIDDLLDISRILSGKLVIKSEVIDAGQAVAAAIQQVHPLLDAKSQRLVVDLGSPSAFICADAVRIQQIVWNLLANAAKFTPNGGRITVCLSRFAGRARIQVSDSGKGIPEDQLITIFDRFTQVEKPTTRELGGLGLGLSLVKHLSERQGGSVRAESPGLGKGSTFTVEFPLAVLANSPAQVPAPGTPPPVRSLEGMRILLVEDEPTLREGIMELFKDFGAEVTSTDSVKDAFSSLESFVPDAIVTDIAMPGEDGYTFLRKLRASARPELPLVPVIALTAFAGQQERDRALKAGFSGYVTKPIDFEILSKTLLGVVRSKKGD